MEAQTIEVITPRRSPGYRRDRAQPVKVHRDRFRALEITGDIFLLDEDTGASYPIGQSGGRFWRLLVEGATVEEAASMLAAEAGADATVVLQYARLLVTDLIEAGAIGDVPS